LLQAAARIIAIERAEEYFGADAVPDAGEAKAEPRVMRRLAS
jgi:hypothetical protein